MRNTDPYMYASQCDTVEELYGQCGGKGRVCDGDVDCGGKGRACEGYADGIKGTVA